MKMLINIDSMSARHIGEDCVEKIKTAMEDGTIDADWEDCCDISGDICVDGATFTQCVKILKQMTPSELENSTSIIRNECESRLNVCKKNIADALFLVAHMNTRSAIDSIEECERYLRLAKLDAKELLRRVS